MTSRRIYVRASSGIARSSMQPTHSEEKSTSTAIHHLIALSSAMPTMVASQAPHISLPRRT